MRSEKQRRFKLVDDNDPIWNWLLFMVFLAAFGLGYAIVKCYHLIN